MTNATQRRARVAASVLAVMLVAPAAAVAQAPLPEAATLTQRYVEAVGGREAILRPQTSRAVGTFEMPAAGLKGELEVVTQSPNRMVNIVNLPGLGVMRTGFDGQVAWALDPIQGARLMEGAELQAMRDQLDPMGAVRDPSAFRSMQTVERTEIDGQACYKVKFVWNSGRESHDCYSAETGLLIATMGQMESPMGKVEVTTRMSEYRAFNGVKMPTRTVQEAMGMQTVITITEVQSEGVDASAINPPAEIRALIGSGS